VLKAVNDVSFDLHSGETLGLAGESGCGKSTIAFSLMNLVLPPGRIVNGKILLNGDDIVKKSESEMRRIRWKRISLVFQEALTALNPMFKVKDQIAEAVLCGGLGDKVEAQRKAKKLLELVGIERSRSDAYPHEFSGGMNQRALIAMALACDPEIIVMDEPGTALDVMVHAQIMEMIKNIKRKTKLSIILITHDLSVIAEQCDRVAIAYAGKIVESADVESIFERPLHPYSRALVESVPSIEGEMTKLKAISGSPPDLINPPSGCMFHPRCRYAMEVCRLETPEVVEAEKNHYVACHLIG
jgi:oligopeptide/dipeptide ABC transporter ATP-binding protein